MNSYNICGLRTDSVFAFPELPAWTGNQSHPADLTFETGAVTPFEKIDHKTTWFEMRGTSVLVSHQSVGRFLIEGGRRIVVEVAPGADAERVRLNVIGTLQAILWLQRGKLPLHASAVLRDGRALVIAGASRSGKSVFTAALTHQGLDLLCDEFAIMSAGEPQPRLLPGYPFFRLWDDACKVLGLSDQKLGLAHPSGKKFTVLPAQDHRTQACSVSDVIILDRSNSEFRLHRLSGGEALANLLSMVHVPDCAQAMGALGQVSAIAGAMLGSGTRVWRLTMPDGLDQVPNLARQCLDRIDALGV